MIAGGAWVQVKVKKDGKMMPLGLATNVSYDEDWGVQPANVLNHLGPVSYDSQNYTCSVTLGTFVPEKAADLTSIPDGGAITVNDLIPTRDEIQLDGKGREYETLQFVNTATGAIINQFEKAIVASNGASANPNAYVTANMRFNCVKRSV